MTTPAQTRRGASLVPDTTDRELVQRFQQGDLEALGELYDRYQPGLFRFIRARVDTQQVAEDLVGEVFASVIAHLPGSSIRHFRAWLFRIARNQLIDHYRAQGDTTMTTMEDVDIPAAERPAAMVEQGLLLENVQRALTGLESTQRDVVILRFMVGLSLREVADVLDKSVGAIKALQHRGLNNLRQLLAYVEE